METYLLPNNNWKKFLAHIKLVGEGEDLSVSDIGDDYDFLQGLAIFERLGSIAILSNEGREIFESVFIRCDNLDKDILQRLLLNFPPTIALQQYLWGLKNVSLNQVLTVLKATGHWHYGSNEPLTHFLDLLNYANVVTYSKKNKSVQMLISPDFESVPKNVYIDPTRQYSNIVWIKKILSECSGYIYWFDKNFQPEAFEWLCEIADANKIKEIKILSLDMGDVNLSKKSRNNYKRLKSELLHKGINVTWSIIDSKLVKDIHDRWIFDSKGYLRNVPNVNAINSGQKSEMNLSDNYYEVCKSFDMYWLQSVEV